MDPDAALDIAAQFSLPTCIHYCLEAPLQENNGSVQSRNIGTVDEPGDWGH